MSGRRAYAGCLWVCTALIAALFVMAPGHALGSSPAEAEAVKCLGCHSNPQGHKGFLDGEEVSTFVNAAAYGASVHGPLGCSACHEGFRAEAHPQRKYRDRRQYSLRMAWQCRRCHPDSQIALVEVHQSFLHLDGQGEPPLCQDCHGAHDTMPVSGGMLFESEEQYCLGCHSRKLSGTFASGKPFDVHVDVQELKGSAHSRINCSDCHFGFTEEEHPRRTFRNAREFSLALAEVCKRCHFDKYVRVTETIHYKLLSQGRMDVPNCTDCHGAHDIVHSGAGKLATAKRCARCHGDEYETYKGSVHGSALIGEGNPDVPVCIDCHSSHDIADPLGSRYHEAIPAMCSGCHADKKLMDKYGLSTDVVKTYLGDFHGVTLSFYRGEEHVGPSARLMAECTDCHGTHDITGDFGSNAATIKANLLDKCRQCHENAGSDFPDAWMSHYRPGLKHAPLVFLVDMAYSVLMPLMVIGLLLQVVLHVWRFFSSR